MKRALLALVVLVVGLGGAFVTSALLDRPARSVHTEIMVAAPRPVVWDILTDLEGYETWNPYITAASGEVRVGSDIHLRIEPTNERARDADCEVVIINGMRKLEFICRTYLPGVLDREHIFRLLPVDADHVRLVYEGRWEGLLVPVSELEARQSGYVQMARALKRRAEQAMAEAP